MAGFMKIVVISALSSIVARCNQKSAGNSEFVGNDGGSWNYETHLIRYGINFNVGLATFLKTLDPESVLEFGCGIGLYTDYLARRTNATKAYCLEPQNMVFKHSVFQRTNNLLDKPAQLAVNILEPDTIPDDINRALDIQFDLVYSIEVLEHIPRELHDSVVSWLSQRVGKYLIFSAAHPNQDGVGHIAERPVEQWRRVWQQAGLRYQPGLTAVVRFMTSQATCTNRFNSSCSYEPCPIAAISTINRTCWSSRKIAMFSLNMFGL
eukprot:m.82002 g.82002  ORF g.82002 m.82002 type:complete len:265 (+) comp14590_c0_seq1:111-905(+)